MNKLPEEPIFAIGEKNPYGEFFDGQSYLQPLVDFGAKIANVTFEPGCRNHWHIHKADEGGGQVLLVTQGEGWYQEWGKPARKLKQGDTVIIEPGVKHWHGADKDNWFAHLSIEVPAINGSTEWLESVDEEDYNNL